MPLNTSNQIVKSQLLYGVFVFKLKRRQTPNVYRRWMNLQFYDNTKKSYGLFSGFDLGALPAAPLP